MDEPTHLGKYEISGIIGKGAMGVVYKGFDPHILRPVALKTIRKDLLAGDIENLHARFENEAIAAGRLSHPAIVAVYEYGEEGDIAYIAMEYVEGHNLEEYFSRGIQFSHQDTLSIMVQLLDAIGHAHEQGVVHRDIKPANIILTPAGRVKVTDFGIAHIQSSHLTQVGMIMGTPYYMAPEQYMGLRVDGRADIYSAGVVLFCLLTGKKPFEGSREQLAYSVSHLPAPRASHAAPGLAPPAFDDMVEKALSKKPEDRYPTAQAFKEALLEAFSAPVSATISEGTRILDFPLVLAPIEAAAAKGSSGSDFSPGTSPPPSGWENALLKKIEQQLAAIVGPFARLMVKKAAKSSTDLDGLYARIAEELENAEERKMFLRGRARIGNVRTATPGDQASTPLQRVSAGQGEAVASGEGISRQTIEDASRTLALFLGPIAKVLARRAAAQCSSRQQFYTKLAENLSDSDERARFLRMAGSNL